MTVHDAKGNRIHGALATGGGMGTFTTGTFTVIPSPVPKLGLLGLPLAGASKGFSKAGIEIVDSYARQVSAFRPGNIAVAPVSPGASQRVRPQELGLKVDFQSSTLLVDKKRPLTGSYQETNDENAPAVWGAWAPNTRNKPALFRNTPRMSAEMHETGKKPCRVHPLSIFFDLSLWLMQRYVHTVPDVKPSVLVSAKGNNIHLGRRLRPASASTGISASFKTKQVCLPPRCL
jgi:hypothetical protein